MSKFLIQAYRREIPAKAAWCTEWWKHPEAVCRLSGMWRSWEALRLEPGTGTSVWWRDHADHHMAKLLDPQGPFKGCTKDAHGANKVLQPLPFGDPPPELVRPADLHRLDRRLGPAGPGAEVETRMPSLQSACNLPG